MTPELKERWLAALRSGKWPQARGQLCKSTKDTDRTGVEAPDGFCCLGVLLAVDPQVQWGVKETGNLVPPEAFANYAANDLTEEYLEILGITGEEQERLIKLNDGKKSPLEELPPQDFRSIANWIEVNL